MNIFQSHIGRRQFLSIGSIVLASLTVKSSGKAAQKSPEKASEKSDGSGAKIAHNDWLNLTTEKAIEPDLPICDPHHHLWSTTDDVYLMEDFIHDLSGGHNVVKTVFVEAYGMNQQRGTKKMEPVEYTEFVVTETGRIKSRTDVGAAIVGYADLMKESAVIPLLESHMAAGKGRFRGIRLAPGSVLSDSKFKEGFSNLHRYNLSCDAIGSNSAELVSLAQAFPDTPLIINHIGNPMGIGAGDENAGKVLQEWKNAIKALAACPNIYMKLGGLGMNSFKFGWNNRPAPIGSEELAAAISPYFTYCIEKFRPDRCMFESNFPVDRAAYSYTVLWNAFKRFTVKFTGTERSALFYNTAVKVYRLKNLYT